MTTREWVILGIGTALTAAINWLLLRRVFEPLRRLERVMRAVDPGDPGQRAGIESPIVEVAGLGLAFDDARPRGARARA